MNNKIIKNVGLDQIGIDDLYWNKYISLVDDVIIPFQWQLVNDNVEGADKSYCIHNFKVAAKEKEGQHQGKVFQDTDVAKWLEAVAFSLEKNRDKELEQLADEAIALIGRAQCEDGYINTYYTINKEERWKNLFEGHELYTAGHLIEAAVAYYNATGKKEFLDIMCRFTDYIYEVFGENESKLKGYPGHPEIELSLVKLYRVTGEKKYLELCNYFVRQRGKKPQYFYEEDCIKKGKYLFPEFADFDLDYCQAHDEVLNQDTAEGHAVRAVYLYSAMADLAFEYQDEVMLKQCETLFDNIVQKRMYITGSIGSAAYGERFTGDYDLPNATNYSETCATIGLAMFANRMLQITGDGKYGDVVEQCLYNTLLSGIALDGKHFFYVNPLEMIPETVQNNPTMRHVEITRKKWFGVACCPPNIARTLASLGNYTYGINDDTLYINLFINSKIQAELNKTDVEVCLEANYPYDNAVKIQVNPAEEKEFKLAIRTPQYCKTIKVFVNDEEVNVEVINHFMYIERLWKPEDVVRIELDIKPRFVYSNPRVRENIGKVAVAMGPIVYCAEEVDNNKYLSAFSVDTSKEIQCTFEKDLFGGTTVLCVKGDAINYEKTNDLLYGENPPELEEKEMKMIPYSFWNNRGIGEMIVWLSKK